MVRATGLGSLPTTDMGAAVRLVFDAGLDRAWIPELPARGPWAGMVARGAAMLGGLPFMLDVGLWRLAAHDGVDARRARATLRDDFDVVEENAHDYTGEVALTVAGPWTLAAALFLPHGGRVLADAVARRDVAEALAHGVGEVLDQVRRKLPEATVTLQVDEPALPAVLGGGIPTEAGYFRLRAIEEREVAEALALVSSVTERSVVHSCAPDVPVALLTRDSGFAGVSLDSSLVGRRQLDEIAAAVERGSDVLLGVQGVGDVPHPDAAARRALNLLRPLELGATLADRLWLTPTCGLAGADPVSVPRRFEVLRRATEQVDEGLRRG